MTVRGVVVCICTGVWCVGDPSTTSTPGEDVANTQATGPTQSAQRSPVHGRTLAAARRRLEREVQLLTHLPANRRANAPAAPTIVPRILPFIELRREQTAEYSLRHYGEREWQLDPKAIVLHYTCGPSFRSAWHTFANNRPRRGELPGLCAHYIVDQDGTVYGLVPPSIRCRHANGINHVSIGIEFVQPCLRAGAAAVERAMLDRQPQIDSALNLVRHLRHRFRIRDEDIIGHAMVNRHHFYTDLLGRTNDHGDWREPAVLEFRQRLGARTW